MIDEMNRERSPIDGKCAATNFLDAQFNSCGIQQGDCPYQEQVLKLEAQERWRSDRFIEVGMELPLHSYPDLPWVRYEEYMQAQIVEGVAGKLGKIIVRFPPEGAEDNQLHVHPISDRLITVIEGSGRFIALRRGRLDKFDLCPGTRVWMPRGVLHTFMASSAGLLVQSLHNPWVPFEDQRALVYPRGRAARKYTFDNNDGANGE